MKLITGVILGVGKASLACLSVTSLLGCGSRKEPTAEVDTAKPYAEGFIKKSATAWKLADVESYFGETYRHETPRAQTLVLFNSFSKTLGPIKTLGPLDTGGYRTTKVKNRTETNITFRGNAEFAKASADVLVSLDKVGNGWKVAGFRILTPLLEGLKPVSKLN